MKAFEQDILKVTDFHFMPYCAGGPWAKGTKLTTFWVQGVNGQGRMA